jgi:hypothetical protein
MLPQNRKLCWERQQSCLTQLSPAKNVNYGSNMNFEGCAIETPILNTKGALAKGDQFAIFLSM